MRLVYLREYDFGDSLNFPGVGTLFLLPQRNASSQVSGVRYSSHVIQTSVGVVRNENRKSTKDYEILRHSGIKRFDSEEDLFLYDQALRRVLNQAGSYGTIWVYKESEDGVAASRSFKRFIVRDYSYTRVSGDIIKDGFVAANMSFVFEEYDRIGWTQSGLPYGSGQPNWPD